MSTEKIERHWVRDYFQYRVMVPGNLELEATSVLDRDMVNPESARTWQTHLESLTDEQFAIVPLLLHISADAKGLSQGQHQVLLDIGDAAMVISSLPAAADNEASGGCVRPLAPIFSLVSA